MNNISFDPIFESLFDINNTFIVELFRGKHNYVEWQIKHGLKQTHLSQTDVNMINEWLTMSIELVEQKIFYSCFTWY